MDQHFSYRSVWSSDNLTQEQDLAQEKSGNPGKKTENLDKNLDPATQVKKSGNSGKNLNWQTNYKLESYKLKSGNSDKS